MGASNYVHLDVAEILRATDKALLVLLADEDEELQNENEAGDEDSPDDDKNT